MRSGEERGDAPGARARRHGRDRSVRGEIVFESEADRRDHGETRIITVGFLFGRMVIVGWTPRDNARHVFTIRKGKSP